MRQVLLRRGRIAVENVPAPIPREGHVLVEVAYSLISAGTERAMVEAAGRPLHARALERPQRLRQVSDYLFQHGIQKTLVKVRGELGSATPLGYACAGVVLQVGANVHGYSAGDHVACAGAGIANHAEVVLAPQNLLCRVPDGCDLRAASTMTLGAIALQGVRRAQSSLGDTVAVIGLGLVGQLTVQLLKSAGCRVIGIDVDSRRVEIARSCGADEALRAGQAGEDDVRTRVERVTAGHGVDATIIAASSSSDGIVQQAMEITRKKGRVVVVGDVGLGIERSPFYEKEIDLLISCSYGPGRYDDDYELRGHDYPYPYVRWTEGRNMAEYLRLVANGSVKTAPLLEQELDVADAERAYGLLESGADRPLGILLRYPTDGEASRESKLGTAVTIRSRTGTGSARPRVGVAVIGAGSFARAVHLPNLQARPDVSLRAVVSSTGRSASDAARQFGAAYASTDAGDVLSDPEIDGVVICTRHHLHAELALAALRAGKHVLLEKPLALTEPELQEIEGFFAGDGADGTAPLLMTGFNRRFSPCARRLRQLVGARSNAMLLNYRMNAGYLPPEHWTHGPEGGGRNIGEACHIYDLFTYLVGASVEHVDVTCVGQSAGPYSGRDNFVATMRFSDGSVASLTYTALGAPAFPKEQLDVFTEGRVFSLDDYARLTVNGPGGASGSGLTLGRPDKGHGAELEAFVRAIRSPASDWPIPLWEQLQATRISFAVERALPG